MQEVSRMEMGFSLLVFFLEKNKPVQFIEKWGQRPRFFADFFQYEQEANCRDYALGKLGS
jgi:hypothetical protein